MPRPAGSAEMLTCKITARAEGEACLAPTLLALYTLIVNAYNYSNQEVG